MLQDSKIKPVLPRTRLQLRSIPAELHLAIFDRLDPVSSACLGLTCKPFYAMHRAFHGVVKLDQYCVLPGLWVQLGGLLRQWGGRAAWWRLDSYYKGTMRFLKCGVEGKEDSFCKCELDGNRIPKCRNKVLRSDEKLEFFAPMY